MTAIIDNLATGKKVLDNYILDQRPMNLEEMQNLQISITRALNGVQALFRMLPNNSPIRKNPAAFDLAKVCGLRFIPVQ